MGSVAPAIPLRRLASIRSSNVDKVVEPGEQAVRLCNYVDVYYNEKITSEIDFDIGSAKPQEIAKFTLRPGDVVITKDSETPADIAVPALVEGDSDIVCGYHLAILRPNTTRVLGPFLFWSLMTKASREAFGIGALGVTRYGLTLNAIGSVKLRVPDIETQKQIVDYLERETALIDRLLKKRERQVALLNQRARQYVSELVLGQSVEGNSEQQITGLDHMPVIPKTWEIRRAGRLFRQIAEKSDPDTPVLSVSIHRGISDRQLRDDERDRKAKLIDDRTAYKRVRPGYLAYNMMRAWQGAVGVSTVDGCVSPAYVVARPRDGLHSLYYLYVLRTPAFIEVMRRGSKGITDFRLRLYWEQFKQIYLPVPPIEEQERIATLAARALDRSAKATTLLNSSIGRLKDRRQALISATIAGDINPDEEKPWKHVA